MSITFTWSCLGFDVTGTPGESGEDIIRIVKSHATEVLKDKVYASEHGGQILTRVLVELRSQGKKASVVIDPGHLVRHSCGRVYLPKDWNALRVEPVMMCNAVGDQEVKMPTRLCGCGEFIGYDKITMTHAEDVCNSKVPNGAVN